MPGDNADPTARAMPQKFLELLHGNWITHSICTAAEMRIADLLAAGPRTSEDLAAATDTDAPSLHRLLRALTTIELISQRADGAFELTSLGDFLRADSPDSLRCWAIWWGRHLVPLWENLPYSIRSGASARAMLKGTEGFKHLEQDPQAAAIFNTALAELTRLTARSVVEAYDFTGLNQIVDVGGGHGELLATILRAHPAARGVLLDLPHAIDGAKRQFESAGLADRCEFVAGDFFEAVPAGADAYLLKTVLHDWTDSDCRRILQSCRRAMTGASRVLVIEQVLPDQLESKPAHRSVVRSDLNMLLAHGAQERSEAQLRRLLSESGFEPARLIPAGPSFSIVEAFPAH